MSAPGQSVYVPAGEGETVFLVGDTYTTLLPGAATGGVFTLLEAIVQPEAGPPPHCHHREEETFFLFEGRMAFTIDGQDMEAEPGATIYIPRDVVHSYSNIGEGPARMLFMYSPAGMDGMFSELGKPGRRGVVGPALDPAELAAMAEVADKYGFTIVQ